LGVEAVEQLIYLGGSVGVGCVHSHVCLNLPLTSDDKGPGYGLPAG
jgi:hypothetical protein